MAYDPVTYWQNAGANPESPEHEMHFRRTEVFATQEERLLATLRTLDFHSVLEVGCGWGRITRLVHEAFPDAEYRAIDLSAERIASARKKVDGVIFRQSTIQDYEPPKSSKPDLLLTVETLMHVPPDQIEMVVAKVLGLSTKYVVSLDWAVPLTPDVTIAPWNTCFDYRRLYGDRIVSVERIALQEIYVVDATKPPKDPATEIAALEEMFGITRDARGDPTIDDPLVKAIKNIRIPAPPFPFPDPDLIRETMKRPKPETPPETTP